MDRNRLKPKPAGAKTLAKKTEFKKTYSKLVRTYPGRLIFPSLHEPEQYQGKGSARYRGLLIVKAPKAQSFLDEIERVGRESWGDDFNFDDYRLPVESGESIIEKSEKARPELYADTFVIKASALADKGAPEMFLADKSKLPRATDADLTRIRDQFYAGAFVRFVGTLFSYQESSTAKGISFMLKGVQFMSDAPRLGAEDVSSVLGDDEEEFDFETETEAALGAEHEDDTDPNL